MAITNLYPNLPAYLVQFKDGGLTSIESPTEDKSGKSLLLLGTAFDGPIMEPVQVDSNTVAKVFGNEVDEAGISNGATLTKYAKQAFKCGFHDVRCMRVTGTNASVKIVKSTITNQYEENRTQQFSIPGNLKTIFHENAPMKLGTFSCVVDGDNASPTFVEGDGTVMFEQYAYRAYADVELSYSYFDIQERSFEGLVEKELVDPEDPTSAVLYWDILSNITLGEGEFLYKPEINPSTNRPVDPVAAHDTGINDGLISFTINDDTTVYEPSMQCSLVVEGGENALSTPALNYLYRAVFDPEEIEIAEGDTVTFKAWVAKKIDVVENKTLEGNYEEIPFTFTDTATEGTFSIEGKEEGTDYVVNNNAVTFLKAGRWPRGSVTGTYTTTITETKEDSFTVNSKYGGSVYNGATIEFSRNTDGTTRVTFTKPADKIISNADLPFYYDTPGANSAGVTTIGQLREQLDNYSFNNVFDIVTDDDGIPQGIVLRIFFQPRVGEGNISIRGCLDRTAKTAFRTKKQGLLDQCPRVSVVVLHD